MSNLYLVFFLIGAGLFLFIVMYSVLKKKQGNRSINQDTSSYIDPSDVSGEYLDAPPELENDVIEPSFRLDSADSGLKNSTAEKQKKKAPVFKTATKASLNDPVPTPEQTIDESVEKPKQNNELEARLAGVEKPVAIKP